MKYFTTHKVGLVLLLVTISLLFLSMIRQFLMVILLAGIFTGMANPIYKRFLRWFKGRAKLASLVTLLAVFLIVLLPFLGLLGIITAQAFRVSRSVAPWVQDRLQEPSTFDNLFSFLPFSESIEQYQDVILQKAAQVVDILSRFLIESLSAATMTTVNFIFMLFLFLYTMYFFFLDGDKLLNKILYYMPLHNRDEERILEKFSSVTRATIKGTLVIGVIQGTLGGLAFAVAGIKSALFWGTIMTILSIIPGIGSALVWLPAAIILAASGKWVAGIGLFIFGAVVVGTVDNFLRPALVGHDTKMHELLILFSTIGGIIFFGIVGFIIGPIVAALFVTIWEIYAETFQDVLPVVNREKNK